jgi:hypothetical protein
MSIGMEGGSGPGEMLPLAPAEKLGAAWASKVGASNLAELRKIPADRLLAASQRQRGLNGPIMDG